MIIEILKLDYACDEEGCDQRADFLVMRHEEGVDDALYHCKQHLPDDAKAEWLRAPEGFTWITGFEDQP